MGEQKKTQEPDLNQLKKVRREKLADLQANGKNPFEITKYDVTCHAADVKDNYEEMEGKHVTLAGRIMQKRVMGKASFCNILDQSGNIQSYVARDSIGEEEYKDFKKMDIGDIVGLEGEVFKTKTGEISIHASAVKLLSKSLQILVKCIEMCFKRSCSGSACIGNKHRSFHFHKSFACQVSTDSA